MKDSEPKVMRMLSPGELAEVQGFPTTDLNLSPETMQRIKRAGELHFQSPPCFGYTLPLRKESANG